MSDTIEYKHIDAKVPIQSDSAPDLETKVYFYPMRNANDDKTFLQDKSISFVYIGFPEEIKAILSIDDDVELTVGDSIDTFGKKLVNIKKISGKSNEWIIERDLTYAVTLAEPLNVEKHKNGTQEVFYLQSSNIAKEPTNDDDLISNEGSITFSLVNFRTILDQFDKARIIFHNHLDLSDDIDEIVFSTQNQALIHSIFAKGDSYPATSPDLSRFGDIELVSQNPLYPMRIQVAHIEEKLVLAFPWLDYDWAMPLYASKLFSSGAKLDVLITNEDDRNLVEDVILMSYLFANEFKDIPLIEDATAKNYGLPDPKYIMGHSKIQVAKLFNQDPKNAVDKLMTSHKQLHPTFDSSRSRYQPVHQVLNALSTIIYSSYASGGGNNGQNQALLPWYLQPTGAGIKPTVDETAKTVTSNPDVIFQSKSIYFNDNFGNDIPEHGEVTIGPVSKLNLSNMKNVQIDRKITLDIMPDTLSEENIALFPNDQSVDNMGFITYLPLPEQQWEKFMLNSASVISNNQAAVEIDVPIPQSPIGTIETVNDVVSKVIREHPGSTLVTSPIISIVDDNIERSPFTGDNDASTSDIVGSIENAKLYFENAFILTPENFFKGKLRTEQDMKNTIATKFKYSSPDAITIHTIPNSQNGQTKRYYSVKHSEFSDARLRLPAGDGKNSYSVQGREFLLDKQQFRELMFSYGFLPSSYSRISLKEKAEWKIKHLDELTIKSVQEQNFSLRFLPKNFEIEVPSISVDNEEISTKKVIFT